MRARPRRWSVGLALSLAALSGAWAPANAVTPAGTPIDNVATATYTYEGAAQQSDSPVSRVRVATLPGLALDGRYDLVVYPGQQAVLAHKVRNTGNTTLSVSLARTGGAWPCSLILDGNGDGRQDAGESAPPTALALEAGASLSILALVAVPAGAGEGDVDAFVVTAADSGGALTATTTDRLTVHPDAPAVIQLVADPATILGNGKDRSKLTATVLTGRGTPVPDGTPVTFTTPRGVFEGGLQTVTLPTQGGIASTYLTADIVSTVAVTTFARVVAGTPATGIAEAEVQIVFSPAAVAGLVTDHAGYRPVPNLSARLIGPDGQVMGSVVTGADGAYIFFVPREGEYTIEVPVLNSVGDLVVIRQRIVVDRLGGAVFRPEGAVVGVVIDAVTHQPIANTILQFELEDEEIDEPGRARALAPGTIQITTDARGGFVVNGLALGRYCFSVSTADASHYPLGEVDVDLRQAGEYVVNADILLDPVGYVYDRETGERVPNAQVTLFVGETPQAATAQGGTNPTLTGADGVYRFVVGAGRYRVRVTAPGYRTYEGAPLDVAREVFNLNVPLDPLPALSLQKTADRADARAGSEIAYTLTASNTGRGTARNVSLVDTLPERLSPVAESLGAGVAYDAARRRLTWPVGDLARGGGTVTVAFRARVDAVMPEGATDLVNRAFLVADGVPDPSSGGDVSGAVVSDPVSVRVTAAPRLVISKTADQALVNAGESARFTIRFSNTGDAPASSVTLRDTLPAGLALADGTTVATWQIPQLDPGAEATQTVEAVPQVSLLKPGMNVLTNRATIGTPTVPAVEATADVRVLVPYLRVTKRALVSEAEAGDVVPFEILVENLSETEDATAIEVRDLLPDVLRYRPNTTRLNAQPSADPERRGGTYVWRRDRLAAKESFRLVFHTIMAAGRGGAEDVVNTAEASAVAMTGQAMAATPSRASVHRRKGFFGDRGLILGRLFVDQNGNRMPDLEEPGLANVAVYTDSGIMSISDEEGKYVIPDIMPGEHVVRVDLYTLPAGYKAVAIDSANARQPRSRFCRLQRGGLAKANFAFEGKGPLVGSARPGTPLLLPPDADRR